MSSVMVSASCCFEKTVKVGLSSINKQAFSSHIHHWWTNRRGMMTTAARITSNNMSNNDSDSSNSKSRHERKGAWVEANPRVCLHDVPTKLRAGGLPPNSPVTLAANLIDERGKRFYSNAHFISDEEGEVDLRDASSVGGSYEGVFPEGLLATLSSVPYEKRSERLYRRQPMTPLKIRVSVSAGHTDLSPEKALGEVELERHFAAPGVQRVTVRSGRVRGALYLPSGPGPFPGVIDMFGSVGGLFEFRSTLLASRGFASLALAVFSYEDLPPTSEELDLDYFEEAMQLLLSHPKVIPDRCGTVANSKSGDIAFNMGVLFEPVKAVVGVNALTFNMHTKFYYKGQFYTKGVEVPQESMKFDEEGLLSTDLSDLFNNDFPYMIHVEEADDDTYFLVACGEEDACGFKQCASTFRERMSKHGKRNYETILYPGAGHILHPPYDPFLHNAFHRYLPSSNEYDGITNGTVIKWGGTPRGTCHAQVDLWQRMRDFFMQHVRDESPWYQNYLHNSVQEDTTLKSQL